MTMRCGWVDERDPIYVAYHDEEWGVPLRDDRALWELLCLEGFQAGLSWITILRKRAGFRAAFAHFRPEQVAEFQADDIERLMQDPAIVRSRAKIEATINSARIYLEMQARGEALSDFIWEVVDGKPVQNNLTRGGEFIVTSPAAELLSKRLRGKGFKFCGPVITYAFMQAAGLVNDHEVTCPRFEAVCALG
jgi:DNA-3-methyladenine glycosylase I